MMTIVTAEIRVGVMDVGKAPADQTMRNLKHQSQMTVILQVRVATDQLE